VQERRLVEENLLNKFQNIYTCIEQLIIGTQCQACREKEERKIDNDGNESKQGEKREELRPAMMNFNRDNHIPKETEKRREHKIGFAKKRKILWTLELRQKFTEALEYLGGIESNSMFSPILY